MGVSDSVIGTVVAVGAVVADAALVVVISVTVVGLMVGVTRLLSALPHPVADASIRISMKAITLLLFINLLTPYHHNYKTKYILTFLMHRFGPVSDFPDI